MSHHIYTSDQTGFIQVQFHPSLAVQTTYLELKTRTQIFYYKWSLHFGDLPGDLQVKRHPVVTKLVIIIEFTFVTVPKFYFGVSFGCIHTCILFRPLVIN